MIKLSGLVNRIQRGSQGLSERIIGFKLPGIKEPFHIAEVYSGSTKTLIRQAGSPSELRVKFTDQASVYNLGGSTALIPGFGKSRLIFGQAIFNLLSKPEYWMKLKPSDFGGEEVQQQLSSLFESQTYKDLCRFGMPHHSIGLVDAQAPNKILKTLDSIFKSVNLEMRIKAANPIEPTFENGEYVYQTSEELTQRGMSFVVPLELLSRGSLDTNSSFINDSEKNSLLATSWGLNISPEAGQQFALPFVHASTKREPGDPYITRDRALQISGLSEADFDKARELIQLKFLLLKKIFGELGFELFDMKDEVIYDPRSGEVAIADITTLDEMRGRDVKYPNVSISKQLLRAIYKKALVDKIVKAAERAAEERGNGTTSKDILNERGFTIPQVRPETLSIIGEMYETMAQKLYSYSEGRIPDEKGLGGLIERINTQILSKEAKDLFTPDSYVALQSYLKQYPLETN
ncbi:MAG: phosphoribosylaminoimidazolesuccinocarboxamide synthase [Candidatus Caenarcaniphilales bacterium]|nr:phosphoribosylaminoimidazolesuccinocarboxamide synthase [Candidatus Caenarcaniphilales bacterium]